jgi:crossover junction endodeoxyribonuclease RuvC
MLVLGVDPGLTRCGLGVVAGRPGRAEFVDAGVIRTPAGLDTARRLLRLEAELEDWIARIAPDAVAVEQVFAQHNLMTVVGTAQAAGVALLVAARHGLPVACHTPSEVKAAITGSGRADKAQVGYMVSRILGLDQAPKPADAADAVALAICHAWRGAAGQRWAEAAARAQATPAAARTSSAARAQATQAARAQATPAAARMSSAARAQAAPARAATAPTTTAAPPAWAGPVLVRRAS